MGIPAIQRRNVTVKHMTDRHQEIIRRIVRGEKPTEVAAAVGMTKAWVSTCIHSPILRKRIEQLQGEADEKAVDIRTRLLEISDSALDVLENIVKKQNDANDAPLNLRASVAKDLLDRAGYGAVKRVESKNLHAHLNAQDIDEIVKRASSVDLKDVIEGDFDEL